MDTGSTLTLVHTNHWNHPHVLPIPVTPTKQRLVGVDGNPLCVQGIAVVCITLVGKKFTTKVTIVDYNSVKAILGMDFLAAEDCCIDVVARPNLCSKTEPEHGMSNASTMCDHH